MRRAGILDRAQAQRLVQTAQPVAAQIAAASVLPSPVCISAMLPRARASAPRSCTSYMSCPRIRDAATAAAAMELE